MPSVNYHTGAYATDAEEVQQAIVTRFWLQRGDVWARPQLGVDTLELFAHNNTAAAREDAVLRFNAAVAPDDYYTATASVSSDGERLIINANGQVISIPSGLGVAQ